MMMEDRCVMAIKPHTEALELDNQLMLHGAAGASGRHSAFDEKRGAVQQRIYVHIQAAGSIADRETDRVFLAPVPTF